MVKDMLFIIIMIVIKGSLEMVRGKGMGCMDLMGFSGIKVAGLGMRLRAMAGCLEMVSSSFREGFRRG